MIHQMRPPGPYRESLIELASWIPKNSIVAEIGSFAGESSSIFLDSGNIRILFCIDPWIGNYDSTDLVFGADFTEVEREFDKTMKPYSQFVKVKKTSVDAAQMFPDHFFDYVYVDGCHLYESVKEDITTYLPKIRSGGWMMGHDYIHPPVRQACLDIFHKAPWSTFNDSSWIYIV